MFRSPCYPCLWKIPSSFGLSFFSRHFSLSCFFDSGFRQPFLKSSSTSVATHSAPSPPDFSSNARSIWIHMVHFMVKISQNGPKMVPKMDQKWPRHSFGSFACEVCLSIFNGDGLELPEKGPKLGLWWRWKTTVRRRCEVRVHPQDVQHQTHLSHPCLLTSCQIRTSAPLKKTSHSSQQIHTSAIHQLYMD